MAHPEQPRLIFITGTDTGVGKTLLTGLLLHHLRQSGCHALALKPFCSGSTADVEILHALQDGELSCDEINPFYFAEPVAPLVAARIHRRKIPLDVVLDHIRSVAVRLAPNSKAQPPSSRALRRSGGLKFNLLRQEHYGGRAVQGSGRPSTLALQPSTLLIEGSGGLLVPLGEGFTVSDLIKKLVCEVIVVARNRLGTLNHTLLTVESLQSAGIQRVNVVIMQPQRSQRSTDPSRDSNPEILAELIDPVPVISLPFLGVDALGLEALKRNAKKCKKTLARILL